MSWLIEMLMHLAITFVYGMWMQGCKRKGGGGGEDYLFIKMKNEMGGVGFLYHNFCCKIQLYLSLVFHSNGDVNN
jgi:hypothetical protein